MATERVGTTTIVLNPGRPVVAIVASRTVLQRAEAREAPMSCNVAEARVAEAWVAVVCLADIPLATQTLPARSLHRRRPSQESWLPT